MKEVAILLKVPPSRIMWLRVMVESTTCVR